MRAELSASSNVRLSGCHPRSAAYCYQTELPGRVLLAMCFATEEMCRSSHDRGDHGQVSECEQTL